MKRACAALIALPVFLGVLLGQTTPPARPDLYHVHFAKAALGKASQLGDFLKAPDPKAAMPGHTLVLRHQSGESWDYVSIEHLGSKTSLEAVGTPVPAAARDLSDWHDDTFVNGPPWADFARAMGIDSASASKTAGSVYLVSVFRAAPGHRDQLEKLLGSASAAGETSAGSALFQHLEGGAWQYLTLERYNSWQEFATSQSKGRAQVLKGTGPWFQMREHASLHNDTLTDRIAP